MGVAGLTTFIYENRDELSESNEISDCRLVIDGHSLMFDLAGYASAPVALSQEYESQASIIFDFIERLRFCGIEPYVIFDGPSTLEKRNTVVRTLTGNVAAIEGLFHGGEDNEYKDTRLLPVFSVDTIQNVFTQLRVPYCNSIEDADAEIVALANKLQCPVLAEDSDYFIFNVEHGYLPLQHFDWCEDDEAEQKKTIKCFRFMRSFLCQKFNVSPEHLPFLSMVLGNDWLQRGTFHWSFLSKIADQFGIDKNKKTWRTRCAVEWLSFIKYWNRDMDSIYFELLKLLPYSDRWDIKNKMIDCYSLYTNLPDISRVLQFMKMRYDPTIVIEDANDLESAIRRGLVHFGVYHLCEYGYVLLPSSIVCDTEAIPPHDCCREIRDLSYSTNIRRFFHGNSRSHFLVAEYSSGGDEYYGRKRIVSIFRPLCLLCHNLHSFDQPCSNFLSDTYRIVGKLLNIPIEIKFSRTLTSTVQNLFSDGFSKCLDVIMLAVIYWFKKTFPERRVVIVLMLAISRCLLDCAVNYLLTQDCDIPLEDLKCPGGIWDFARCADCQPTAESSKGVLSRGKQDTNMKKELTSPELLAKDDDSNCSSRSVNLGDEKNSASKREEAKHLDETQGSLSLNENSLGFEYNDENTIIDLFGSGRPESGDSWWVESTDYPVDMVLLHSIAEWECVLWATTLLRQSVEYDGLNLGLYGFYGSNMAAHEINARLQRSGVLKQMEGKGLNDMLGEISKVLTNRSVLADFYLDIFASTIQFLLSF